MTDFIFGLAKSIRGVTILWGNNYPLCDSSSTHILFLKVEKNSENQNQLPRELWQEKA